MKTLSPKIQNLLEKHHIHPDEIGAVKTFLLLKSIGLTITRSVLWQLDALIRQVDLAEIDEHRKKQLNQELKNHAPVAIFPETAVMENYMQQALIEAKRALQQAEIPVGAVVVRDGEIIARAHNLCVKNQNVAHHAEILALAEAAKVCDGYRLNDCDLYVTLEPCVMCAGAIMQARIKRLIFAAHEPKTGAVESMLHLFDKKQLNHHTAVHHGVCRKQALDLLQQSFQALRNSST